MTTIAIDGQAVESVYLKMKDRNVADSQDKLAAAHVTITGSGGLGSNIAIALARAGVGHLTLIDFDEIEHSNLNRQQFKLSQVGLPKVLALKQNILEFNPFVEVTTWQERVTEDNVLDLFTGADIICEAFDDQNAKAMLLRRAQEVLPETPIVMGNGLAGIHDANQIQTVRQSDHVYLCGDGQTKGAEGLMAARVLICAGHQANQILRLILEKETVEE
ncbi:Molybdopterin or thiamine biosynthesis adenylyltransferase (ThiF) [Fructobacillus tropaeoli]|uniref:sulfur carrier protein ThiS adenylyltransferase ThiF n=1 Tax=Fructobacillus tropaeoli TaxID=709323 RepID=UPI002D8FDA28|nr:Molybdopterin or thiamine biosynthesis adenylyltransferase (ThiF) [Fructobacillus tropaeoli]